MNTCTMSFLLSLLSIPMFRGPSRLLVGFTIILFNVSEKGLNIVRVESIHDFAQMLCVAYVFQPWKGFPG